MDNGRALRCVGTAIGMSVNEFNEVKDLEVVTFRRDILGVCLSAVEDRDKDVCLSCCVCQIKLFLAYQPN